MNKHLEFETIRDCVYDNNFGSAILYLLRIVEKQQLEIEELQKSIPNRSAGESRIYSRNPRNTYQFDDTNLPGIYE